MNKTIVKPFIHNLVVFNHPIPKSAIVRNLAHKFVTPEGDIVKLLTDEELAITAVFSSDAVVKALEDLGDSPFTNWNSALLILTDFRLDLKLHASGEIGEYVLMVSKFKIWNLQSGYHLQHSVKLCMKLKDVQDKMRKDIEQIRNKENTLNMSEVSASLSQLLENMTNQSSESFHGDISTDSFIDASNAANLSIELVADQEKDPVLESWLEWTVHTKPFSIEQFLVSSTDEQVLDNIAEWKCDYRPAGSTGPSVDSSEQLNNTDVANTQTSDTDVANTQTSDTDVANTQASDTDVANTQASDTDVANTQASDTDVANTRASDTDVANTQASDKDAANTRASEETNHKNMASILSPLSCHDCSVMRDYYTKSPVKRSRNSRQCFKIMKMNRCQMSLKRTTDKVLNKMKTRIDAAEKTNDPRSNSGHTKIQTKNKSVGEDENRTGSRKRTLANTQVSSSSSQTCASTNSASQNSQVLIATKVTSNNVVDSPEVEEFNGNENTDRTDIVSERCAIECGKGSLERACLPSHDICNKPELESEVTGLTKHGSDYTLDTSYPNSASTKVSSVLELSMDTLESIPPSANLKEMNNNSGPSEETENNVQIESFMENTPVTELQLNVLPVAVTSKTKTHETKKLQESTTSQRLDSRPTHVIVTKTCQTQENNHRDVSEKENTFMNVLGLQSVNTHVEDTNSTMRSEQAKRERSVWFCSGTYSRKKPGVNKYSTFMKQKKSIEPQNIGKCFDFESGSPKRSLRLRKKVKAAWLKGNKFEQMGNVKKGTDNSAKSEMSDPVSYCNELKQLKVIDINKPFDLSNSETHTRCTAKKRKPIQNERNESEKLDMKRLKTVSEKSSPNRGMIHTRSKKFSPLKTSSQKERISDGIIINSLSDHDDSDDVDFTPIKKVKPCSVLLEPLNVNKIRTFVKETNTSGETVNVNKIRPLVKKTNTSGETVNVNKIRPHVKDTNTSGKTVNVNKIRPHVKETNTSTNVKDTNNDNCSNFIEKELENKDSDEPVRELEAERNNENEQFTRYKSPFYHEVHAFLDKYLPDSFSDSDDSDDTEIPPIKKSKQCSISLETLNVNKIRHVKETYTSTVEKEGISDMIIISLSEHDNSDDVDLPPVKKSKPCSVLRETININKIQTFVKETNTSTDVKDTNNENCSNVIEKELENKDSDESARELEAERKKENEHFTRYKSRFYYEVLAFLDKYLPDSLSEKVRK